MYPAGIQGIGGRRRAISDFPDERVGFPQAEFISLAPHGLAGNDKATGRAKLRPGVIQPSEFIEQLFRATADLLLTRFLKTAGIDGQLATKVI